MTDHYQSFLPLEWSQSIVSNSVTGTKDNLTTNLYRFINPQQLGKRTIYEKELLPTVGENFSDWHGLVFELVSSHLLEVASSQESAVDSRLIEIASSQESALDTLQLSAPDEVKAFFQYAESQLMARTEITAQFALKLLNRIKTLISEICPSNLQGRILAMVDGEDGSATIEWIRSRSRLGFALEKEHEESSWFVVLPNGISKSGYLYGEEGLESLRDLLEEFVAAGD
jgi:hypothetical protein